MIATVAGQASQLSVQDDSAHTIALAQPATRIVSLAPNISELMFAVGAGDKLVGVMDYSDYPEQAKLIPRVGDANAIDLEKITLLQPDLIIAWRSGNPIAAIDKLHRLGFRVYESEPSSIADIASTMQRFAELAGTRVVAQPAIHSFEQRYQQLKRRYQGKQTVSVFYEIWNQPLMTVSGKHLISEAISICGGANVFADINSLASTVSVESVLAANPQVIIAGDNLRERIDEWQRWTELAAVRYNNLFLINWDHINRHTPRILDGVEEICNALEQARSRIASKSQ